MLSKKVITLAAIIVSIFFSCFEKKQKVIPSPPTTVSPTFKHEGDLYIIKNLDTLKTLQIELAITEEERNQGLMYRTSMKENQGMLFVFSKERVINSFYMKNTKIPLDLIYINSNNQIVHIHKNAIPLDESNIPSNVPSQYVLEINGGICDKWGIQLGNQVVFREF